jgi:exo-beta-1,3-glucanase (GH17 family)
MSRLGSRGKSSLSLMGIDLSKATVVELKEMLKKVLDKGIHGLCFSPYLEDQGPGSAVTEDQIRLRMEVIKPHTKWIRSFSCTEGNEMIPKVAHENGIKTLVGAWIGTNLEINEREIENVIKVAKAGYADIVAVGNEVLLREDASEEELRNYILRVKEAIPGVPVGYVDAYYEFVHFPRITEVCDVLLANCYPFWEGCKIDYSLLYMKDMYHRAQRAGNGKKVIISETGWPNKGTAFWGAEPSEKNALKYLLDTCKWAEEDEIEFFYFSTFDEIWKIGHEGDVGAYWGIWDKDGIMKYEI